MDYYFNGEWKLSRNLTDEELIEIMKFIKQYEYNPGKDRNRDFEKYKVYLKQHTKKWKGPVYGIGISNDDIGIGDDCCWTIKKDKIYCYESARYSFCTEWIVCLMDKFLPKNIKLNGEMKYVYTDNGKMQSGSIIIEGNNVTTCEHRYGSYYNITREERKLVYEGNPWFKTKL